MIKTHEPNTVAPVGGHLFCLARLGDGDGLRPTIETDLTPRAPFSIDPGWYAAHWYGGRSGPITGRSGNPLWTICAVVRRNAEFICLAVRKAAFSARLAVPETRRSGPKSL